MENKGYVYCKKDVYFFIKGKKYRYELGVLKDTEAIKIYHELFDGFYFNMNLPKNFNSEINFHNYFCSIQEMRMLKLKKIKKTVWYNNIVKKIKSFLNFKFYSYY